MVKNIIFTIISQKSCKGNLILQKQGKSALFQQADVKFYAAGNGFQPDPLVVAVDRAALLRGQIHGREPVNMVA